MNDAEKLFSCKWQRVDIFASGDDICYTATLFLDTMTSSPVGYIILLKSSHS